MSTAVLINYQEVQQISLIIQRLPQRKVNSSLNFDEKAAVLRKVANKVKHEWNNFSTEEQKILKELAYQRIEPAETSSSPWRRILALPYVLYIFATQKEALSSCIEALDLLVRNILDAVERHDPTYQVVLSDTLELLSSNKEPGRVLKPEDTRGWLRSLSDRAIRDV